nr:hypothetical protein [Desulfomonile tiedjei]
MGTPKYYTMWTGKLGNISTSLFSFSAEYRARSGPKGIPGRLAAPESAQEPGTQSFEIVGDITDIEVIAVGSAIREIGRLRKQYGESRWRKLKGIATVRLPSGRTRLAELHWYEAHGIGKKEFKRKRYLD